MSSTKYTNVHECTSAVSTKILHQKRLLNFVLGEISRTWELIISDQDLCFPMIMAERGLIQFIRGQLITINS
ncbi:hypothetical protein ACQP3J_33815, partial [Escherichia coli]